MACRKRFAAWQRAWKRTVASTRGILLAVAGVALVVAGILLRFEDVGQNLVILGVGVLALGIVLPLVGEFVLGPGGLTFKQAFRERDAQFQPLVLAESEENSLQRFARLLTGDADRAPVVVEEALARTYRVWTDIPAGELDVHVVCEIVRVALGASKLHLIARYRTTSAAPHEPASAPGPSLSLPAPPAVTGAGAPSRAAPQEALKTAEGLASLPIKLRAVLLLRHIRDLDEHRIAWILGDSVGAVREALQEAEVALEQGVASVSAGSA